MNSAFQRFVYSKGITNFPIKRLKSNSSTSGNKLHKVLLKVSPYKSPLTFKQLEVGQHISSRLRAQQTPEENFGFVKQPLINIYTYKLP